MFEKFNDTILFFFLFSKTRVIQIFHFFFSQTDITWNLISFYRYPKYQQKCLIQKPEICDQNIFTSMSKQVRFIEWKSISAILFKHLFSQRLQSWISTHIENMKILVLCYLYSRLQIRRVLDHRSVVYLGIYFESLFKYYVLAHANPQTRTGTH